MASVICLHFSMQGEYILEHTNDKDPLLHLSQLASHCAARAFTS